MEEVKFIVSDIMSAPIVDVPPGTSVAKAAQVMLEKGISSLAIKEDGHIVGIVTDKDFVKLISKGGRPEKTKIRDIMTTELIHVDPKLTLQEAAEVTKKHNIRHLLVKTSAEYVGIVSVKDIIENLYEELKEQNTKLRAKIDELEKFYRVAVGRELTMVKLKKKIRELQKRLGEPEDLEETLFIE